VKYESDRPRCVIARKDFESENANKTVIPATENPIKLGITLMLMSAQVGLPALAHNGQHNNVKSTEPNR
jgi:hypothetical protein